MADQFLNTGDGLYRTTNLVSPSSDFTALLRFKPLGNIAGTNYRVVLAYLNALPGPATAYTRFFGIFGTLVAGQQQYYVEAYDGITDLKTPVSVIAGTTETKIAYIRKGNVHIFQVNDTEIGRFTLDISGVTWVASVIGGDGFSSGAGNSVTNENLAYYREFSRALTLNEVFTEFQSSKAYDTTDLVADVPLITDKLDISGHNNHYTDISTISNFVNNTLPATPVDIGAVFPFSRVVTQAEFNVSNLFWFKFTTLVPIAIGSFTNKGGTFTPKTFMYMSDGNSEIVNRTNVGFFRVVGPGDYYFKVIRSAGGASNFDFTSQFDIRSITVPSSIALNSVLVNDDTAGFPSTLWDIGGNLLAALIRFPAGEMAAAFTSGETVWHDVFKNYREGTGLALFDNNLDYVASLDTTPTALGAGLNDVCMAYNGVDVYILNRLDRRLWKLTKSGILTDTGAQLSAGSPTAIGVSIDGTILYYAITPDIKKWDIINNVALPNLYNVPDLNIHAGNIAVSPALHNGEILVLSDDSLVTWYVDFTATKCFVIHVTSGGVLAGSFEQTGTYNIVDHIAYANDSTKIIVWLFDQPSDTIGKLALLDVATGVLTSTSLSDIFSGGADQVTDHAQLFGRSVSCMMVNVLSAISGGIYKIVPGKRNDTLWVTFTPPTTEVVKIPDPFADTGQIGV